MVKIAIINKNRVLIELPHGKTVSVSTDDGTALELATETMDWSELHNRVDRSEEITQRIDLEVEANK